MLGKDEFFCEICLQLSVTFESNLHKEQKAIKVKENMYRRSTVAAFITISTIEDEKLLNFSFKPLSLGNIE